MTTESSDTHATNETGAVAGFGKATTCAPGAKGEGVAVAVTVDDRVDVQVREDVAVAVWVDDAVVVAVSVSVAVGLIVEVGETVPDSVGVPDSVAVRVMVGVRVIVGVSEGTVTPPKQYCELPGIQRQHTLVGSVSIETLNVQQLA